MKHYTYVHKRDDTGEIFYVGIGTKSSRDYPTFKSKYYRAHTSKGRNVIWERITSKTSFTVEIVYESDDYDQVKEKEKHLIQLYGKKSYHGTLCNISDGGDGTLGVEKLKGKDSPFSKKVYQYGLDGKFIKEWDSGYTIQRELNYFPNPIYNCCNKKGKNKTAYGFQWSYDRVDILIPRQREYHYKAVLQYTKNGEFIKEWKSAREVYRTLGIYAHCINKCCNKKKHFNTAGGFKWTFKT